MSSRNNPPNRLATNPQFRRRPPSRDIRLRVPSRFTDPGAIVIGSFDIQALAKSELVRSLVEQVTGQLGENAASVRAAFDKWVASGSTRRVAFSISTPESVVFLVEGRTDPRDLDNWTRDGKMTAFRLDAERLLIGSPRALGAAAARWRTPVSPETDLIHQARLLSDTSDVWLAAAAPAAALSGVPFPVTAKGFAIGASLRDGVRLSVGVDTSSAKAARDLLTQMREQIEKTPLEGAEVVTRSEGNVVRAEISFDAETVKQAFAERFSPELRHRVNAFVEEQKPRPKKAMIYGLDDEPREVLLSRP